MKQSTFREANSYLAVQETERFLWNLCVCVCVCARARVRVCVC
jgi:hypothetical protein